MVAAAPTSLKNLFFGIFFATLVVLLAFLLGGQQVRAAGVSCYDIIGQTTGVPFNGVNNSGVVHFDAPLAPAYQYEACVEDTSAPLPGDGPFTVKGWAWDDNLGWISFYCDDENGDGAPYENLGIPCGNIPYKTEMQGLIGSNPGRLSGYAWGDNTGWISFNCVNSGTCGVGPGQADYWVEAETTDNDCLGEVYGVTPPSGTCSPNSVVSTYAWSDNVGWFDFTGVKFPWVDLISIGVDVVFEITPDPATVTWLNAPYGNNSDSYELKLTLTKSFDGSAIDPLQYAMTAVINWTDTVDTDQTDAVFDSAAVTKPSGFPLAEYVLATSAITKDATSVAPTSAMNGLDRTDETNPTPNGSVDYAYESFDLPDPPPAVVLPNELTFDSLDLSIEHIPTGICVYGAFGTCAAIPFNTGYEGSRLEFKPAIDISRFNDAINTDFMNVQNLVAAQISTVFDNNCGGACSGVVAFVQLFLPATEWDLKYDPAGDFDQGDPTSVDLATLGVGSFTLPFSAVCMDVNDPPQCSAFSEDAYAYSTISYTLGGKSVSYFSNKLPRVKGTLVVNPVAEIRGNVYSQGVTNPQSGQEVRSLGDISTNLLRNTIVQNVENIIAGIASFGGSPVNITGYNEAALNKGFQVSDEGQVRRLLPDFAGVPRAYYFTGDVIITNPLDWESERTIIIEGGNLYINKDIRDTTPGIGKAKLGLIVLDDLTTVAKEGNVFIGPDVLNIQANLFADGSVFSYKGVYPPPLTAYGEPVFTDEPDRYNSFKNQLFVEGSLASQNTIGGAVKNPPILGDGTVELTEEGVYGNTPSGRSRARLYDLNFLRYYGLVFERFTAADAPDPSCIGDAIDQQNKLNCIATDPTYTVVAEPEATTPDGDLVPISGGQNSYGLDPNSDYAAVYVNFDPPTASLPGFGVTGGVDIRLRP